MQYNSVDPEKLKSFTAMGVNNVPDQQTRGGIIRV